MVRIDVLTDTPVIEAESLEPPRIGATVRRLAASLSRRPSANVQEYNLKWRKMQNWKSI
jgi:hypothetical protein